jgi:hypothetical protein
MPFESKTASKATAMKNWIKIPPSTIENLTFKAEPSRNTPQHRHLLDELRLKLNKAEELVAKLGYNLREIQDAWSKPK